MTPVLVINSGSSSFKYQLIDMAAENVLAAGLVERIGEETGSATHTVFFFADEGPAPAVRKATSTLTERIPDHTAGFDLMIRAFAEHGPSLDDEPPIAVGHRVVHGGARFFEPTLITPLVEINIDELSVLAPLHNPANLQGITAAKKAFPTCRTSPCSTPRSTRPFPRPRTRTRSTRSSPPRTACAGTGSTAHRTSS